MKAKAADLYSKMTDYNTIVFTFLWCDVTKILGIKHKQVQEQKLQISDVGRLIKLLCVELTEHYRIDSEMPENFPWLTAMELILCINFGERTIIQVCSILLLI